MPQDHPTPVHLSRLAQPSQARNAGPRRRDTISGKAVAELATQPIPLASSAGSANKDVAGAVQAGDTIGETVTPGADRELKRFAKNITTLRNVLLPYENQTG